MNRDNRVNGNDRPVRILNATFAHGTWIIGQDASPQNFIRFSTATTSPALTDDTIPIDYKGKTATIDARVLELFDPQNKTIVRIEIDYPSAAKLNRSQNPFAR